jgi:uncharacterized membrane protein
MKMSLALILLVSIVGLVFSGYLSYYELSGQGNSCTVTTQWFGVPACVIGFAMYLVILILAIIAAYTKGKSNKSNPVDKPTNPPVETKKAEPEKIESEKVEEKPVEEFFSD